MIDNSDQRFIVRGGFIFACALISVAFGFWLWGEIKGTYHLKLAPEYIDLLKYFVSSAVAAAAVTGTAAVVVAGRATKEAKERKSIEETWTFTPDEEEEDHGC